MCPHPSFDYQMDMSSTGSFSSMKLSSSCFIASLTIALARSSGGTASRFLSCVFVLLPSLETRGEAASADQSSLWFLSLGRKRNALHNHRWSTMSFPSLMDVTGPSDTRHCAVEIQSMRRDHPLCILLYFACSERRGRRCRLKWRRTPCEQDVGFCGEKLPVNSHRSGHWPLRKS